MIADAGLSGVVGMTTAGSTRQMTLSMVAADGSINLLLPPLYEPQLLSIHGDGMILRGWQRMPDGQNAHGATYLQEWLLTQVGSTTLRPSRELMQSTPLQLLQEN